MKTGGILNQDSLGKINRNEHGKAGGCGMNKEYVVHRALSCKVPGQSRLIVGETERMQPLDRAGRKGTLEHRLDGPWQEEREEGAGSPGLGAEKEGNEGARGSTRTLDSAGQMDGRKESSVSMGVRSET